MTGEPFPFTGEEDAIILALGSDIRAVADCLFVPAAAVRARLAELIQPPKEPVRFVTTEEIAFTMKKRQAGWSFARIGVKLDRNSSTVRRALERVVGK